FALFHDISDLYGANHVLALIFTNLLAFFLTAILTGFLAERARASEKALKKKEIDYEELESVNSIIVSTLDSGLVTVNSQGRVRVFNRYAAELTGIEQQAAYDLPFSEIFPEVDLAKTGNLQDSRHESIYKSKSGEKRILGVKSAPLLDKEGHSIGAVVDMLDVTDLRAMESRLKRADRLAAIGELSARIAHEVRNPLASISGSVQLIAESGAVPDADKRLLAIIQRETARLDSMLSEFLQYARPFPPVIRRFSLKNLITELSTLLQGDSRFSAVKITDLTQEPLEVHADHDQIRQTVWNLLLNAAESMPDGGEIRIESHLGKAASAAEKDFLFLSFTDTGCGIDPASMVTVFEPFFTTKQGGTGLGLANVYRILEAHKGSIAVESQLGSGTRFTISLPLSSES
ncbi:MAG: PAS domain S-box protein, partial [Geobacter sp.]|nr:PAS domain S-box protein [Geobacter sp.]